MPLPNNLSRRQVYLLRCWEEPDQAGAGKWRFSLEEPHTGMRRGFTSLETLVACLADALARPADEHRVDEAPPPEDAP